MTYTNLIEETVKRATSEQYTEGLFWYANAQLECRKAADEVEIDFDVFVAVVCAISPGCRWSSNIEAASHLVETGEQLHYTYSYNNILKALLILETGNVSLLSGVKVVPFYNALVNPNDNSALVVDTWIYRFLGIKRLYLRKHERIDVKRDFRLVSGQLGMPVPSLQAILWTVTKGEWKRELL